MSRLSSIVSGFRKVASRNCRFISNACEFHTSTSNLSNDRQQKMAIIKMEMEMERQSGNFFIPDRIEDKKWNELLSIETPDQRIHYYRYLKKIELDEERTKRRRARHVEERRTQLLELNENSPHIQYGLGKNTMFMKIYPSSINRIYYQNLLHAVMYGQKVVFDMVFEDHMDHREKRYCVDQMKIAYSAIKRDRDAFHLHICNLDPEGVMQEQLKLTLPFLQQPDQLVTMTPKSYLDLFPKEKLVYLVPNCGVDLKYKYDDVYIIGGLVDRRGQGPLSLAKARKEGIRMAQFPLDRYLEWKSGAKSLTLDQTMNILITLKDTMNWKSALQHVPMRKIINDSEKQFKRLHHKDKPSMHRPIKMDEF